MRTAIIRAGVVDHIVNAGRGYTAPAGATAVPTETGNIGDAWDGVKFTPPPMDKAPQEYEARIYAMLAFEMRLPHEFDLGDGVVVISDMIEPTRIDLAALERWGRSNPSAMRSWHDSQGARIGLSGDQFVRLSEVVQDTVLTLYNAADKLVAGAHENPPTVDSLDQIVAVFAAASPPRAK